MHTCQGISSIELSGLPHLGIKMSGLSLGVLEGITVLFDPSEGFYAQY